MVWKESRENHISALFRWKAPRKSLLLVFFGRWFLLLFRFTMGNYWLGITTMKILLWFWIYYEWLLSWESLEKNSDGNADLNFFSNANTITNWIENPNNFFLRKHTFHCLFYYNDKIKQKKKVKWCRLFQYITIDRVHHGLKRYNYYYVTQFIKFNSWV